MFEFMSKPYRQKNMEKKLIYKLNENWNEKKIEKLIKLAQICLKIYQNIMK
jgi:hypothetical protein